MGERAVAGLAEQMSMNRAICLYPAAIQCAKLPQLQG
jgi:hypothetical protein